ncbi:MAG: hypothetical protein ACYCSB_03885 [bacterium]
MSNEHELTIKDLKEAIKELPDNMPVLFDGGDIYQGYTPFLSSRVEEIDGEDENDDLGTEAGLYDYKAFILSLP